MMNQSEISSLHHILDDLFPVVCDFVSQLFWVCDFKKVVIVYKFRSGDKCFLWNGLHSLELLEKWSNVEGLQWILHQRPDYYLEFCFTQIENYQSIVYVINRITYPIA